MFSATGSILSGSKHRPDIYTLQTNRLDPKSGENKSVIDSTNCVFNKLGYIPGVSTVTGGARTLLGIVHSIVHLASAIFDTKYRTQHLKEAKLGGKNIVRGFVEMLPVLGNIIMFNVDQIRTSRFEDQAREITSNGGEQYNGQTVLFIYGEEAAKLPMEQVISKMSMIPNPSLLDVVKILQGRE